VGEFLEYLQNEILVEIKQPYIKYIPLPSESDFNRFWQKVAFTANANLCWNWTAEIQSEKKPYGIFHLKNKSYTASRVAYAFHFKEDPKELCVLHKCDNPQCVNPAHLFLGTNMDNVIDKVKKGRQSSVECWNKGKETKFRLWDNKNCKATKEDFLEMKSLYEQKKMSTNELVKKFKISKQAISKGIRALGADVPKIYTVLKEADVIQIREKRKNEKTSYNELAEEFNIHKATVYQILSRQTWKHI